MVRHTLPSREEGTRGRRSAPGSLTTPTGDRGGHISHQEEQQFICCIVYSLDIHTHTHTHKVVISYIMSLWISLIMNFAASL